MSERTAPAIVHADALLAILKARTATSDVTRLVDDTEALRRAIAAFHMEAIRFRMHSVDRGLTALGNDAPARREFEELRRELEAAGFQTRSHAAPDTKKPTNM